MQTSTPSAGCDAPQLTKGAAGIIVNDLLPIVPEAGGD
jgi:hypothetical protein